jgi:hypothetical protein
VGLWGRPRVAFALNIARAKIVAIDLVTDPERPRELNPAVIDAKPRA